MYRAFQGLRVRQVFTETAAVTSKAYTTTNHCNSITIYPDGSDVTVTLNGTTWTVKGTDQPFDEVFEPFMAFTITSTGAFRAYVRG